MVHKTVHKFLLGPCTGIFRYLSNFSGKVDCYLPFAILMGMSGILGQNVSDNRDLDYSIDRLSLLFLFFRLLCVK